MAGVGFELKKLFRDDGGLLGLARGCAVTAAVTEGPMLLMVVLLFALRAAMNDAGAGYAQAEAFVFLMSYAMIFSQLFSGGALLFADRFISDCIYAEDLPAVLPALYALCGVVLGVGVPVAGVYLYTLHLSWSVRLGGLVLFAAMLVLWLQMSFLSAVKRYEYVLLGFAAGVSGALLAAAVLLRLDMEPLPCAVWSAALGFLAMLGLYQVQLASFYPGGGIRPRGLLGRLRAYRALVPTGFLLALGLFGHNFVFWGSDLRTRVLGGGVYCVRYDVPAFFAALSILPMLVQFVISLETKFAPKNRAYFDTILYGGRWDDILAARSAMQNVLYSELAHMMELQLIVSVVAATFGGNFLQTAGFDEQMTAVFRLLCFGYCLYGLVKCGIVLLLYFDDRLGACFGAGCFALVSIALSLLTRLFAPWCWGAGFALAGAVSAGAVLWRLHGYLSRLEYHVFCAQPLYAPPQEGALQRMARRLDSGPAPAKPGLDKPTGKEP